MIRKCAFKACSTCWFICVAVFVMNNIARHIVVTSRDKTMVLALNGSVRTPLHRDITDSMFAWDDIVHVQFVIVTSVTVKLKLVRLVNLYFIIDPNIYNMNKSGNLVERAFNPLEITKNTYRHSAGSWRTL